MTKRQVARDFRDKHGMEMATRKAARILYKENPLLFKDYEDARYVLSQIEGKRVQKGTTIKTITHAHPPRPENPYKLPDSDAMDYSPYVIQGHKRGLLMNDVHLPYQDNEALTATIRYAKKEKPDFILLNGDIIDCHTLSRFVKDPKARSFAHELEAFRLFFETLQRQFPNTKIYFKIGNHEERYEHFLAMKAGELEGVQEFKFENIIKARANGIEIIGERRYMKLNSLNGIHGHEYVGGISVPVNIARGLYLKGKVSAFQGHNHASSEHNETNMDGEITTTWSIGCLCNLHPQYMPLNKWNHGFALVDLDPNGKHFEFRNKRIYKGKVL